MNGKEMRKSYSTEESSSSIRPRPRPRRHQEGCPQFETTRNSPPPPPEAKPTPPRKQVPLYLKRDQFSRQNAISANGDATIDIRRQSSAPPEFGPERSNASRKAPSSSASSIRSSSSISNIFSDFGREMQRKFSPKTKSLDQTHFSTTNNLSILNESRDTTIHIPASEIRRENSVRSPAEVKPGIGIYMDEDEVTVGVIRSNISPKTEVVLRTNNTLTFTPEEISFRKPTDVEIPTFSIFSLIKSIPRMKFSFDFNSESFKFTSEELLAIFFEKLIQDAEDLSELNDDICKTVVLTLAFPVTSLEKERIKQGFKIAGVSSIRILSSVVATAIAHALEIEYFNNFSTKFNSKSFTKSPMNETKSSINVPKSSFNPIVKHEGAKLLFVVHSLINSFSMSVVQISHHCITMRCCIGWENLDECREESFEEGHSSMFSKFGDPSSEQEASVWLAYKGAVDQLMKGIPENKINKIIGITRSWNEAKLNYILTRLFGDDKDMIIQSSEGPLTGACILAQGKILPRDLEVHDASRSNLKLVSGAKKWRLECKNRKFIPGNVFTLDIPIPAQGTSITLYEEFSRNKLSAPIGQYKIQASMQPNVRNYDILVRCFVSVDQDGVFTIGPHFSKEIAVKSFTRVDTLTGDISLEIRRLKVTYENANYTRSKKQGEPSDVKSKLEATSQEEIKVWASDAERLYIDTLRRFNCQGRSPEEIKAEHEKAKTETLRRFKSNCEENGVDPNNWMSDMESKLENMFQDVKEFLVSSRTKFKDWFSKKFPKNKSQSRRTSRDDVLSLDVEEQAGVNTEGDDDDMMAFKSYLTTSVPMPKSELENDTDKNNNGFESDNVV